MSCDSDLIIKNLFRLSEIDSSHLAFFSSFEYPWQLLQNLPNYLTTQAFGIHAKLHPSVYIENRESVYIHESASIEPQTYIKGPVWIGPNCQIRQGAYIRGGLLALDSVVIGHCTEVKNSIFLPHAKAAHFAYVGDSLLGFRVNLGAGCRLANLRFDKREITFKGDRVHQTQKNKLGAILADDCKIGCNSVLSPGTLMGMGSVTWPCTHVQGVWSSHSKVKTSNP